jgi:hypothetical protein
VDSEIGSDSATGTSGDAWKTVDHACTALVGLGSSDTLYLSGDFVLSSSCSLGTNLVKVPAATHAVHASLTLGAPLAMGADTILNGIDLHIGDTGSISFGNNAHVLYNNITRSPKNGPWVTVSSRTLRMTGSRMVANVLADSSPAVFEPILSVVNGHLILVDCIFEGSGPGSNFGSAIEVGSNGQLDASGTHFIGLPSGAVRAHSGGSANFTSCIFTENDMIDGYLAADPLSGSAFSGSGMGTLIIDSCQITSNRGRTSISVDTADEVVVQDSLFHQNQAPSDCSAFRLIDVDTVEVSGSSFTNNSFGDNHWWTTCISVKPEASLRSSVTVTDSVWSGNTGAGVADADLFDMTGYSMLFQGRVDAVVRDLDFSGENPWFSSVGAFQGASITVKNNFVGPEQWRGYVAVCGNITLETDLSLDGRLILSRQGVCPELNLFDMGGHDLSVKTPVDPTTSLPLPDVADNWLQSGNFYNGRLEITSLKTTICCDIVIPETAVESDTVRFTDVEISAATTFAWGTSRTKFELLGSSILNLESGAVLLQTRPKNDTIDHEAVIEGHVVVKSGAQVYAAGLRVIGTFDLQAAARLHLFPSNWRGIQHPLFIDGTGIFGGTIFLNLEFMSSEYVPNLIYQADGSPFSSGNAFFEVLKMPSPTGFPSMESPFGLTFDLDVVGESVLVRPNTLIPRASISDALDALILEWALPMPINDPDFSDCAYIFAGEAINSWFTAASQPRCSWESTTRMVMRSASLPAPSTSIMLHQINLPNVTDTGIYVFPPTNAVTPIAQISVVVSPCGNVILSGAASSGIGSFDGVYSWSVTCNVSCNSLESALNAVNEANVELSSSLFAPSVGYSFHLVVSNAASVDSLAASSSFEYLTEGLQVGIIGAKNRQQPLNSDLTLQARFDIPVGCVAPQVTYEWSGSLISAIAGFTPAPTSVLHIPRDLLVSAQSGYYDARVTATVGAFSSTYEVTIRIFLPEATLVSSTPVNFAGSEPIILSTLYTPAPSGTMDVRYVWTLLQCADEFAEASYRPVVSLNETVELPQKCQGRTSTFDIRETSEVSRITVSSDELTDGFYLVLVEAFAGGDPTKLLAKTEIPFYYTRAGTTDAVIKVIVPPASALQFRQKIPIRLEVETTFAGTLTGSAITQHFSGLFWRVNGVSSHADINRKPYLILPYSAIQNGRATISVSLTRGGINYQGAAIVSVGETPSGGSLATSLVGSEIRLSTRGWTSHVAGAPGLRYQFMLRSTVTGEDLILSDLIDSASIVTSAFATDHIAVVRAFDVLDRFSEVTQELPSGAGSKRQVKSLDEALMALESALKVSDWRLGNDAILGILLEHDPTGQLDVLTNSAASLASSLPNTSMASAALLEQFALLQTLNSSDVSASRTSVVLLTLSNVLSAQHSRFGSLSESSKASTNAFFRVMERILPTISPFNQNSSIGLGDLTGELPQDIISRHADQVLSATYPEEVVHYSGTGLGMFATRLGVSHSSEITIPSALLGESVKLSVTPSDWAGSASNGYIGFYQTVYNGTYPIATPSPAFTIVAETKFTASGADGGELDPSLTISKSSDLESGTPGKYKTTFQTTELLQTEGPPSCVSAQSGSWQPACTTSTDGNSVTCSCDGPTTLSLAFDLNDPAEPGTKGKSKLSKGAAAAIGVCIAVILLVVLVVLIVLFVPGAKNVVRPFRKRKYEKAGP